MEEVFYSLVYTCSHWGEEKWAYWFKYSELVKQQREEQNAIWSDFEAHIWLYEASRLSCSRTCSGPRLYLHGPWCHLHRCPPAMTVLWDSQAMLACLEGHHFNGKTSGTEKVGEVPGPHSLSEFFCLNHSPRPWSHWKPSQAYLNSIVEALETLLPSCLETLNWWTMRDLGI